MKHLSKLAVVLCLGAGIYYFSRPASPSVLITDLDLSKRMINEIFPKDYVLLTSTFTFESKDSAGGPMVYFRELKGIVGQLNGKEADAALIQDCIQKWLAKQVKIGTATAQTDGSKISVVIPYDAPQTRGEWRYTLTLKDSEKKSAWDIVINWNETAR